MERRSLNLGAIRILAAAAVAAVALIAISLPLMTLQIDRVERQREIASVDGSLTEIGDTLLERLNAAANWDPALLHMDTHFDPQWVKDIFTEPFEKDVGSRLFAVFDPQGKVMLALERGRPVAVERIRAYEQAASGLLLRMRQAEAAMHTRTHFDSDIEKDWISDRAFVWIQDRPYLLHASLVGGDLRQVRQVHDRTPIVMFASDLETKVLPGLQSRLFLHKASFGRPSLTSGQALVELRDGSGKVTATLSWSPELPGRRLLSMAAVPISLGLGALLLTVGTAYRHGVKATLDLIAGEAKAQVMASHDALTGLPNRIFLHAHMQQALVRAAETGGCVAILLMDLDGFKAVNDINGHRCGDELLVGVAHRLSQVLGAGEICARLGGDEFIILSECCDAQATCELAVRAMRALASPFRLSNTKIGTSASIGISIGKEAHSDAGELLRQADVALYKSKEEGRNTYRAYHPSMDEAMRQRRELEDDLRQALAQGDLYAVYQPQVNSGRLVGVEALVRWTHPTRGPISPAVFVKLAEECGLIEQLGTHMLQRAFTDSRKWPNLKVAINVSAIQLRLPEFLPQLETMVMREAVDPSRFELEITEGLLMVDDRATKETLAGVKALGFRLALDDFGTGYSSLSYLRRFSVDTIKIDQSFIAALTSAPETERVVRAIMGLAEALSMAVVAEGVETEEQLCCLTAMGCQVVQGYLTGRPAPAPDIDSWTANSDARKDTGNISTLASYPPSKASKFLPSNAITRTVESTSIRRATTG